MKILKFIAITCLASCGFCLIPAPGLTAADSVPPELVMVRFSDSQLTPSPSCLASTPYGEVFVGIDLLGSLGKGPGQGRIVKLKDVDHDGKADVHSVFAHIDNPRGLIPVGDKVYVLHTEFSKDTGLLEGMHLSYLIDADRDGIADGPAVHLVENVSVAESNRQRGADHTTNGIQLGIDGWIYIAVGDFGMVGATGTDGKSLTVLGGGIVRVRPDGTNLELYTHGLRNIYDIAIDPYMNIFTRGNTNDGGGWNIRFIHNIQNGEYGYPVLFKNFTNEIIPALADLGGGSGTGALFFHEPGWPDQYNHVPMMCDWGRNHLFIHRVSADGASFTQSEERFIEVSQITDVAADASGRLYISAWDGAGFQGNPQKGYVVQVTPSNWVYKPFPELSIASLDELVNFLHSDSSTARLHAQQELLSRGNFGKKARPQIQKLALNRDAPLHARVAAVFTLKQLLGETANRFLVRLSQDSSVREFALRALTDIPGQFTHIPEDIYTSSLNDSDPRVRAVAAVGLGRLGNTNHASDLLAIAEPPFEDRFENIVVDESTRNVFSTPIIQGTDDHQIDVRIEGFTKLFLSIEATEDGNGNDHGSWFEPILIREDGSSTRLTDLTWFKAQAGWGNINIDRDCTDGPLRDAQGHKVSHGIGSHAPSVVGFDLPAGYVRFSSRVGLSSSAGGHGSVRFLVSPQPQAKESGQEGPHATPHPEVIIPHLAIQSVIRLNAIDEALSAVGGAHERAALWALSSFHSSSAVTGLIHKLDQASSSVSTRRIISTLIRLYHREMAYDGSWWWGTRPDTRGPYYRPETWESSPLIESAIRTLWNSADDSFKKFIVQELEKHRISFEGIQLHSSQIAADPSQADDASTISLDKITAIKGEVGSLAIEDVLSRLQTISGDPEKGREVFNRQGCTLCHTLNASQPLKGPYMGHIGGIMTPSQIAEAILNPNATISQGFATVLITTLDGNTFSGFISRETADEVDIRDITGSVSTLNTQDITDRSELNSSMMPAGLASALSLHDFASLVTFLSLQK